ncbi:hypothetical protein [Methylomonas methanica]|uniref:Uncharacterized protein n=1 Tax=Methylomonas methanica (strain DSM 25384 / MC09) TaxID=857087 RepID=F9ZZ16_METMM|nr:hypothetical protein [Methylomonas methanica]AEF99871.1 hypothetical protein Metme_1448 [Methylomonas methanica MC09]
MTTIRLQPTIFDGHTANRPSVETAEINNRRNCGTYTAAGIF